MPNKNYRPMGSCFLPAALLVLMAGCGDANPNPNATPPPSVHRELSVVPATATVVAEGTREVTFRAPGDGTVYLYDVNRNATVDFRRIERGNVYEAFPDRAEVSFAGQVLPMRNAASPIRGDRFRVYFNAGDR